MKALVILKQNRELLVKNNADLDFFTIDVIIQELEAQLANTERLTCEGCSGTAFNHVFLKEGTWMGTKKLPSEFFRSSEYDFGWDYYPKKDTMQHTCKTCGKVAYSLPKGTK